jgi:hypothetical protein
MVPKQRELMNLAALLAEIQSRTPKTIPERFKPDLRDPLAALARQITASPSTFESTSLAELLWWVAPNPMGSSQRAPDPAAFSGETLHLLKAFISDYLSGRYSAKEIVAAISKAALPPGGRGDVGT